MRRRLFRSRNEKVVAGVCGGLAEYFNTDPTLIRLAVVILTFATGGATIIAYIIAMIIVPKESFELVATVVGDTVEGDSAKPSETSAEGAKVDEKMSAMERRAERSAAKAASREADRQLRRERREERERNRSTFSKILPGGLLVIFGLMMISKNFFWWSWGDLAPMALIFLGAFFILRQWDKKQAENGSNGSDDTSANGDSVDSNGNGHGPELSINGGNS